MCARDRLFRDKLRFKTLEYGLDDTLRIKNKDLDLIEYSFAPSDVNFLTIWMPKGILTKKNWLEKAGPLEPF